MRTNQTLYFCTVSDSKFALETMALFRSLNDQAGRSGKTTSLSVLCLDDEAVKLYNKLDRNIKTVTLADLSDPELLRTRNLRKHGEFAQTSKASLVCHLLETMPQGEVLSFVDSDIYYFSNPGAMLEHDGEWSVLVTSHWFTEAEKHRAKSFGTYNSGFVCFRNDDIGRKYAALWREKCIEWCFNRVEEGKFTDQYYLENWPQDKAVKVSSLKGLNVGTWNLHRFKLEAPDKSNPKMIFVDGEPLISYHFHGLKLYLSGGKIKAYPVTVHNKEIYSEFIQELQSLYEKIHTIEPSLIFRFSEKPGVPRVMKQIIFRWFQKLG